MRRSVAMVGQPKRFMLAQLSYLAQVSRDRQQRLVFDALVESSLDHATVYAIGRHVIRLVNHPESFPLLEQKA